MNAADITPELFISVINDRKLVGEEKKKAEKELKYFTSIVRGSSQLRECNLESLNRAFDDALDIGLTLNPVMDLCNVLPRWAKSIGKYARYEPNYKGLIQLAKSSGKVLNIDCQVVRQGEHFEFLMGTEQKVVHHKGLDIGKNIIGVYSIATLDNGQRLIEVMNQDDLDSVREQSDSFKHAEKEKKNNSVWHKWESQMDRKACIKRQLNYLPKDAILQKAIELDNKGYLMESWSNKAEMIRELAENSTLGMEQKQAIFDELDSGMSHMDADDLISKLKDKQVDPVTSGHGHSHKDIVKAVDNAVNGSVDRWTGDEVHNLNDCVLWLASHNKGSVKAWKGEQWTLIDSIPGARKYYG